MKTIFLSLWILMTVALTACSSSSTVIPGGSANNNLPIQTQLALGTLKLDGTDWDVTAAQAQELVILWQVYRELSQSDTAAQAEVDGLIAQIQETMTTEQLQAIADMQITQQDVLTAIQGMTVVTSSSTGNAVSSPSNGGMPAGGPPMEGGAPPEDGMPGDLNGAGPSSSNSQAQSADTGTSLAGSAGVPAGLVEALIQLLEQKIAS